MEAITYTEMVNNWSTMTDKVTKNHIPVIITSEHGKPVVVISLEDFNSWQETDYLTRSPANVKDLMDAMQELKNRQNLVHRNLFEE